MKMREILKVSLICFGCLIVGTLFSPVYAKTTAAAFLDIPVGARNIAMGETGVTSNDVNSIYWNPSGLADISNKQLSFMHTLWFENINYESLYYCQPISQSGSTFGIGLNYLGMNAIDKYDAHDNLLSETYTASNISGVLCYAKKLQIIPLMRDKLQIGGSIKYIYSHLDDEKGIAFASDIGSLYHFVALPLSVGLAVQNIGTKMKFISQNDPLPLNIKLGFSYQCISSSSHLIVSILDINKPMYDDIRVNFGAEYSRKFDENIIFSVRVGYKTNTKGYEAIDGLSIGFGFSFRDYSLDYGFVPYGDLGDTHRISVIAKFGNCEGKERKRGGEEERMRGREKEMKREGEEEMKIGGEEESKKNEGIRKKDIAKVYKEGVKYLKKKNYFRALMKFNDIIAVDPSYKDVLTKMRKANNELIKDVQ